MKLYLKQGACSLAPHIVLHETGLACDTESVDLKTKRTASGADFTQVNPLGYVPALALDDGQVLTEVAAIVQYLAHQAPAAALVPADGTLGRYRVQEWLSFIGTELHRAFGAFFNPKASPDWRAYSEARLVQRLDHVDRHLQQHTWLAGEQFSVADAYLYPIINWSHFVGLDMSNRGAIAAWHARMSERPAVQAALAAENNA